MKGGGMRIVLKLDDLLSIMHFIIKGTIKIEANQPFGVSFGHCNHGYAELQHFHVDHKAVGLQDVGSKQQNSWY